ncbi:uncharacterized protein J3D65DRAFT_376117 [Phyllosticta citribraziliensis]|uniref:Uncharacterized protein n=1 Tax=Phyllosticta citribraziliensis TaxID=989973 RepID=A0ABR1LQ49_9PEZI
MHTRGRHLLLRRYKRKRRACKVAWRRQAGRLGIVVAEERHPCRRKDGGGGGVGVGSRNAVRRRWKMTERTKGRKGDCCAVLLAFASFIVVFAAARCLDAAQKTCGYPVRCVVFLPCVSVCLQHVKLPLLSSLLATAQRRHQSSIHSPSCSLFLLSLFSWRHVRVYVSCSMHACSEDFCWCLR